MSEFNFQGFTFHGNLLRALLSQSKPPQAEDNPTMCNDDKNLDDEEVRE